MRSQAATSERDSPRRVTRVIASAGNPRCSVHVTRSRYDRPCEATLSSRGCRAGEHIVPSPFLARGEIDATRSLASHRRELSENSDPTWEWIGQVAGDLSPQRRTDSARYL